MQSLWIGPSGAHLRFVVTFAQQHFANLSLFDADGARILLHVSLRQMDDLCVCNDRSDGEEIWGREVRKRVDLSGDAHDLDVRLSPGRTEVWLDGKKIHDVSPKMLRRPRFLHLPSVCLMPLDGGLPIAGFSTAPASDAEKPARLVQQKPCNRLSK